MFSVGIDIGSTAAKVAILDNNEIIKTFHMPTGWSSAETSERIDEKLQSYGINRENSKTIATGYGRISVPFADKTITEITCHAMGAKFFAESNTTVIDIGGQDTKVISLEDGKVKDFTMNDKCSAGTGKFIEVMANSLGVKIDRLTELAATGSHVRISSMCTVFAESEIISLIGSGVPQKDIAYGIVDSVIQKVKSLCAKHGESDNYFLTGGFSENEYIKRELAKALNNEVISHKLGRFAGALGAAQLAT